MQKGFHLFKEMESFFLYKTAFIVLQLYLRF